MYAVYNHYHIKIKNKIPSPQKGLFDHFTVSPQPLFTLTLFPVTLINLLVLEISKSFGRIVDTGLGQLLYKEQENKYFRLVGPWIFIRTPQLCLGSVNMALHNADMKQAWPCVSETLFVVTEI